MILAPKSFKTKKGSPSKTPKPAVDKAEEKTDVPETQAAPEKTSEETSTEAVVPNNES